MLSSGFLSWVVYALAGLGLLVLVLLLVLAVWSWWDSRKDSHASDLYGPMPSPEMIVTVLGSAAIGPFVMAFATKLGERLGASVNIRLPRRRRSSGDQVEFVVTSDSLPTNRSSVTVEVAAELTDEARLALIELDVRRPELWGHHLRWDEGVKAWLPVPRRESTEVTD
ncbi:hypothetical protein [Streptomyces caeruleatus]|uniref:Uncharacterized protein n=1 Tax=Streptomyces caeruleatus TaxID=661399 RepID=A0A117RH34_9ACTN|nr:hypothetical protein [Streptomyces caeruleatus]KUN90391.1 hypothetical protein AQJ67_44300 [Streptomyces caeruleatus]